MSAAALEWIAGADTGASSTAIWAHMMGTKSEGAYPFDPDDFGRCYRLLLRVPEWRNRISEMSKYSKVWTRLAAAWDELTTLYELEVGTGADRYFGKRAPRLYARMIELRGRNG